MGEDSGLQVHKSLTADPTPIAQEHTDKRMIECMTSEERNHAWRAWINNNRGAPVESSYDKDLRNYSENSGPTHAVYFPMRKNTEL